MSLISRSLSRRMTALILIGAGLVLIVVLGLSYTMQRRQLMSHFDLEGRTLVRAVVFEIESQLVRAETAVRQATLHYEGHTPARADTLNMIRRTLESQPSLFGMAVALPRERAAGAEFKILYGWRAENGISVEDRLAPERDYQHDWFLLPYNLKRPVWVEPYFDEQAGTTMVTYAAPIMQGDEVVAVVTCDLSLKNIRALLAGLQLGEKGMAVLMSQWGTFIVHPDRAVLDMRDTVFTLAEAQKNPQIRESLEQLGHVMLSGQPGRMRYLRPSTGKLVAAHMFYDTVPSTHWTLGILWPEAQVVAPLVRLNRIAALAGAGSLLLLLIPALWIARSVADPLRRLADAAQQLSTGDFGVELPRIRTRDEVARLTAAFDRMRVDLKRYINDLTATTAAKERMAGELSAAREIQMSIVPKLFPPLPCRIDIDLYAMLIPALEVGGDLYDFALLDDDHLYVAIGDVSGKGIPASLLMAVGKTLLKSTVQSVRAPDRALQHVNDELSEDNDSCMFITMFCGILNLKTGDFIYANAGHNPPVIVCGDGTMERLGEKPSPALGARAGVRYQSFSRRLKAGDLLALYTDGVTEAMNPAGELYGDGRLLSFLQQKCRRNARGVLEALAQDVRAHAAGAPQSDDITALVVRYHGAQGDAAVPAAPPPESAARAPDETLSLRNHLDELPRLAAWIETASETARWSPALGASLNLVLEEWFVNVVSYAHTDGAEHTIDVRLWRDPAEVRLEVEDDGRPFDPTAQAEADTSQPLEHRAIGGLGIHFIRKTMSRFEYRRENNRNIVAMVKQLGTPSA